MSRITNIKWTRRRQIWLISLVLIVYLLIGAAVFQELESSNEVSQREEYQRVLAEFINSTGIPPEQLANFTSSLRRLSTVANSDVENWSFAPSFFFALTVVTTIGYGQISPVTAGGQAFCCVFALIGIPLTGYLLVKLAESLKDKFNSIRDCLLRRLPENPIYSRTTAPLFVACFGVVIFMLIPAVIFDVVEDWTYGQSLYCAFITLSTIGFGDFVPGQESDTNRSLYKILLMIWIFVGLAFLTLLLEIVNELMTKTAEMTREQISKRTSEFPGADRAVDLEKTDLSKIDSNMTNAETVDTV
eukprot:scpid61785/ scgid3329/ Potassium channel subfamily K member 10; Outward rectifying potassium channel protein TREK-2; TREK-2 K(+) channel subunit